MTGAETNYAQIEKELLTFTHACERLHQYVYGQSFEVETDCKHLVSIMSKALKDCPTRIQRMLIGLQKYDVKRIYTPGKFMFAADTLSRAVDKHENLISEKGADIQAYVDMIVTPLPVSPEKTEQIRNATDADITMAQLKETTLKDWPEKGLSKANSRLLVMQSWTFSSEGYHLQGKQVCHSCIDAQGNAAQGSRGTPRRGEM